MLDVTELVYINELSFPQATKNDSKYILPRNLQSQNMCVMAKQGLMTTESHHTYKCVVFCGISDTVFSRLFHIEVHFTLTPSFSNRHVQFPASEHKTPNSLPLLSALLPIFWGVGRPALSETTKLSKATRCNLRNITVTARIKRLLQMANNIFNWPHRNQIQRQINRVTYLWY